MSATPGLLAVLILTAATPRGHLPPNAAVKYWQAFAELPPPGREQADDKAIPAAHQPFGLLGATASLKALHRAAQIRDCDWLLDYDEGPLMALPHVDKARTLARYACRAEASARAGEAEQAVADLGDTFTLARHVEAEPVFLCVFVGYAIEQSAIDTAAASLKRLNPPSLTALLKAFDNLPPGASLKDCVIEKKIHLVEWLAKHMRPFAGKPDAVWRAELRRIFRDDDTGNALYFAAESAEDLVRRLGQTSRQFDELAKLMETPGVDLSHHWPAFLKESQRINPLAIRLLPPMDEVLALKARRDTRLALLRAAIDVVQGGEGRLKQHRDPAGNGLFVYRKTKDGFELSSALLFQGKPVNLVVGGEGR